MNKNFEIFKRFIDSLPSTDGDLYDDLSMTTHLTIRISDLKDIMDAITNDEFPEKMRNPIRQAAKNCFWDYYKERPRLKDPYDRFVDKYIDKAMK